jgi:hypothetical protein
MPLTPTSPDAICDAGTISFLMLDGDSFVRIDVQQSLLQRVTASRSDAAYLTAFGAHRKAIERIASAKYDEGDFCSFANCRVVPIGPADLSRYAQSGQLQ